MIKGLGIVSSARMRWALAGAAAAAALSTDAAWYRQQSTFRFGCTECGDCCRVSGDVWLNAQEAAALLQVSSDLLDDCLDVRLEGGWRRLRRRSDKCIFLTDDNKCAVHTARPTQCRTYPFWPRILASKEAWHIEPCEGIGNSTTHVSCADVSVSAETWAAWLRRFPADAAAAVEDTEKWAQLVAELDLCPWAKPSLDSNGADFVQSNAKTIDQAFLPLALAAEELLRSKRPDNVAIALVVFPDLYPDDFLAFRSVLDTLEDVYFQTNCDHQGRCLADDVQLAGFHPHWQWAGTHADDPIHFEKRAPHPTISLVRASAIVDAEHASAHIAHNNQRTLARLGTEQLRRRFAHCSRAPPSQ